jgi:hypothetical protein
MAGASASDIFITGITPASAAKASAFTSAVSILLPFILGVVFQFNNTYDQTLSFSKQFLLV